MLEPSGGGGFGGRRGAFQSLLVSPELKEVEHGSSLRLAEEGRHLALELRERPVVLSRHPAELEP